MLRSAMTGVGRLVLSFRMLCGGLTLSLCVCLALAGLRQPATSSSGPALEGGEAGESFRAWARGMPPGALALAATEVASGGELEDAPEDADPAGPGRAAGRMPGELFAQCIRSCGRGGSPREAHLRPRRARAPPPRVRLPQWGG